MHEPQLNNICIFRAKLEDAYGNDSDPLNGLIALLVGSGAEAEIDGDVIKRNITQRTFTPRGTIVGAKRMPLKFSIEVHGGLLSAGVPLAPDYDMFMLSCGLQKTDVQRLALDAPVGTFVEGESVTGGTSAATGVFHLMDDGVAVLRNVAGDFVSGEVLTGATSAATANTTAAPVQGIEYRPVTSKIAEQKSSLIYLYNDHILYLVKGWRGTFDITAEAGGVPMLNFSGMGLWTTPTDVLNLPDVDPADIIPPRFERVRAKLGAYDPIFKSFKFAQASQTQQRDDCNSAEGVAEQYLGGREPVVSFDPEMDSLTNYNPFALWESAGKLPLGLTVGQDAGNRWRFQAPNLQHSKLSKGERGMIRVHQIDGTCTGSGDDEFRITFM